MQVAAGVNRRTSTSDAIASRPTSGCP